MANGHLSDPVESSARRPVALFQPLERLEHGWDGDGAPAPSQAAVDRARRLVESIGRLPDEVDPDALGGVALWFYESDGRKTMIGVRNEGRSVVCAYDVGADVPGVSVFGDAEALIAHARITVARP